MRCSQCGYETSRDLSFCGRCGNLLVDAQSGARLGQAHELERQGRLEEAKEVLNRLLAIEPNHAVARRHLGTLYGHQGKLALAIAEIEAAVELDPGFVTAWYDLGVAYAQAGRMAASVRAFRQTLALDPDYHPAHFRLGLALSHTGDLVAALEHLESAHRLTPELLVASYHLGIVCERLGRLEQARSAFERFLAECPGDSITRDHLREIDLALQRTGDDAEDFSMAG